MGIRGRAANAELFGRERDFGRLGALLDRGASMVTVSGCGGIGKTTFVRGFVAREQGSGALEGVTTVWIDLTVASTLADFRQETFAALSKAFGETKHSVDEIDDLVRDHAPALIVLDNFEQLVSSCRTELRRLSQLSSENTWIVSSREILRLPDERVLELEPLALPSSDTALGDSPAASLFLDRARRLVPDYATAAEDLERVGAIVRKLDGLPLAIELAAARANTLGPAELDARLSSALSILASVTDDEGRQSSIRRALDWSWSLLADEEAAALARCSLFRGSFGLSEGESLIAPVVGGRAPLDVLQSLRDKSLLVSEQDPSRSRMRLLVPVREHAEFRLASSPDHDAAVRSFARTYVALVARNTPVSALLPSLPDAFGVEEESLKSAADRMVALARRDVADAPLAVDTALARYRVRSRPGFQGVREALEAVKHWEDHCTAEVGLALDLALAHVYTTQALAAEMRSRCESLTLRAAALGDETSRVAASRLLALHQYHCGELDTALTILEALFESPVTRADATLAARLREHMGVWQLELGRHQLALQWLEPLAREHPHLSARIWLALCRFDMGEKEQALKDLKGYADDPRARSVHRALARGYIPLALRARGELALARTGLEEAVREWGGSYLGGYFRACLGAVIAHLGDPNQGLAELERAQREARGSAQVAPAIELELGQVHLAFSRRASADGEREEHLRRAEAILGDARRKRDLPSLDFRFSLRALEAAFELPTPVPSPTKPQADLVVAADGSWFELRGGGVVSCTSAPARRILVALADATRATPGVIVSANALVDAAWPGEKVQFYAAKNRLHVAIATLRRSGLKRALITEPDGYGLAPDLAVRLAPGP